MSRPDVTRHGLGAVLGTSRNLGLGLAIGTRRRARGGSENGRTFSEGSEGLRPSEKFSKLSPKTQKTSQKARGLLRSPAAF